MHSRARVYEDDFHSEQEDNQEAVIPHPPLSTRSLSSPDVNIAVSPLTPSPVTPPAQPGAAYSLQPASMLQAAGARPYPEQRPLISQPHGLLRTAVSNPPPSALPKSIACNESSLLSEEALYHPEEPLPSASCTPGLGSTVRLST